MRIGPEELKRAGLIKHLDRVAGRRDFLPLQAGLNPADADSVKDNSLQVADTAVLLPDLGPETIQAIC